MFDFHEKRKIRRIIYSKPVIGVLFLGAGLMSISVYNRYEVAKEMEKKLEDRRIELSELHMRAESIEAKVKYLKDERGVEEELRNRFDVAKEGEQVVILVDKKPEKNGDEAIVTDPGVEYTENIDKKSWFDLFKFW